MAVADCRGIVNLIIDVSPFPHDGNKIHAVLIFADCNISFFSHTREEKYIYEINKSYIHAMLKFMIVYSQKGYILNGVARE